MGKKIEVGEIFPDITYDTEFATGLKLSDETSKGGKTALQFLRYLGCGLCQLDINDFKDEYGLIEATGGRLLVVLQSEPATLAEEGIKEDTFPYTIICDPEMKLYEEFDIKPAASKDDLGGEATMAKVKRSREAGYKHGKYEGEELQLPATFILNEDREVVYAHYGTEAADVPTPEEMADLLK